MPRVEGGMKKANSGVLQSQACRMHGCAERGAVAEHGFQRSPKPKLMNIIRDGHCIVGGA